MILRVFMFFYRLAWLILLPVILLYLHRRSRKDPLYFQHLGERFGRYDRPLPRGALWVHGVSLGETRSALALIHLMLERGEHVVITNVTPAGRREAEKQFGVAIKSGKLAVVWAPLDMPFCYRRFFSACTPRIGLPLEVEIWPDMIATAHKCGVPIYLCNSQYASRPLARDSKGLRMRQRIIANCDGALVKSQLQADRFAAIGLTNITVTGELRFDQPIPEGLLSAAPAARASLCAQDRPFITIASGVEAEEDLYIALIEDVQKTARAKSLPVPYFVYVPRAPERFTPLAEKIQTAGLSVCQRSEIFPSGPVGLTKTPDHMPEADVFLGDSLGEMYFFLALADQVIVGGGFNERGAHNIIEPLATGKPVLVGPYVWTIEFPFVEAKAAGVAKSYDTPMAMIQALSDEKAASKQAIAAFVASHRGASTRTLEAIDRVISRSP
ncbi:glycosyltransferase N-terminal domain-containing protein [Shimia sp.]|uniref:3-deoxy-D-manno-octulosonic acid transferase n=1 Tax=Shimia sp. TaxID=1954381 RepID=UPI0032996D7B